VKKAKTERCH